jgi:hypothetical protein
LLLQDTEAYGLAMQVCIVGGAKLRFEPQDVVEESQGPVEIFDVHEGCDVDEVRHGCSFLVPGEE